MRLLSASIAALLLPSLAFAASPIAVSVDALALQDVAQGAQRVPVLSVKISATCEKSVTLSSVTIHHEGLGSASDILRVYAVNGLQRRSPGYSLPKNEDLTLSLRAVSVPACKSITLLIAADLSPQAAVATSHRFSLVNVETGDGNVATPSSTAQPAPIAVSPQGQLGTVTISYRALTGTVSYGSQRVLARLLLQGSGANQEIDAITLTNDGSASDTDLRNLYFEDAAGTALTGTVDRLDGDHVRLVFDPPLSLERNAEKLIQLRADVRASRKKTIEFVVEENADVEARTVRGRR